MAKQNDKPKSARIDEQGAVTLESEQYRSMILAKLRADIAAKQALHAQAAAAGIEELSRMSYWKMGYWKMKYWKMGHIEIEDPISDPI
jgi:hypothetical protein